MEAGRTLNLNLIFMALFFSVFFSQLGELVMIPM